MWRNVAPMCRNIKILRAPYAAGVTDDDVHAAALQYVRTVGGVRLPGPHHEEAFNQAVETISAATWDLLARLEVGPDPAGGLAHAPIAPVPPRRLRGRGAVRLPQVELADGDLPHHELLHFSGHRHREVLGDPQIAGDLEVGDLPGAELP